MKKKLMSILTSVAILISIGNVAPKANIVSQINVNAATANQLNISNEGKEFIISMEGFSSSCFWDYAQWTIGYGTKCTHTSHPSNPSVGQKGGHTISRDEAKERFYYVLETVYEPGVERYTSGLNITQSQFDALVSLCYNAGAGRVYNAPLTKYLRGEMSKDDAYTSYCSYCITAGGKVLDGLKRRRKAEADLFFKESLPEDNKKWYEGLEPVFLGDSFCAYIKNGSTDGHLQNEGWNVAAYAGTGSTNQKWIFNRQSDGSYVITSDYDTNRLTVYDNADSNCVSAIVSAEYVNLYQKWFVYSINNQYVFRPAHSDRVLDLDGGSYDAGANIQIFDYNKTESQYFKIEKCTWYDNMIPADLGTSFNATISNCTTGGYIQNEGWNVAAYAGDDKSDQYWTFVKQSDGSYTITSLYDTNRLTIYNKEDANCVSAIVTGDEIDKYQKWFIYESNSGYIFRPSHSDRVMDLEGLGYDGGTNIQIYDYNATKAQYFSINREKWSPKMQLADLGDGFFANIKNNYSGLYLTNDGFNIYGTLKTNDTNQVFYFEKCSDGMYTIKSCLDGTKVTVWNGESYDYSSIVVTYDNFNETQKWCVYSTNRGYLLKPSYCDKVMDWNWQSSDIQLWDFNSTDAQLFEIEKTTLIGDCNNDGVFSISDAVMLQKWILAIPDAKLTNWQAADLCEDGVINTFDLVMMKRMLISQK